MLWGMTMVAVLTMGCAHGTLVATGPAQGRDIRGSARVGQEARLIASGPARLVHATAEKRVRWFLADQVIGDDSDCAAAGRSAQRLSESTGAQVTIAPGHVLCAAVAQGATDVMWHQFAETSDNLWALR
jgi:hypothetical protein